MASVTEDFNEFVSLELGDAANPTPWPTVPAGGLEMHQISGEVAGRPNALVRNRCPIAMDSLDHRASIEYRAFSATNEEWLGPAVRMKEVETTWYNISCDGVQVGVEKYTAEGYDEGFASSFTNYVSHVVNIGDRLELRVSGTDPVILQVYHNDVLITDLGTAGTITDAEDDRIVTGNYTGLFAYSESDDQTARLDNFAAQDEAADGSATLEAEYGTYSLTGQAADLIYDSLSTSYTLTAESGTYTITGSDALVDRVMSAASGTFTVTGHDATLKRGYAVQAETGAYVLVGQAANLVYSGAGPKVLVAEQGSYTVTGQNATLRRAAKLIANQGVYTLQGFSVVGGTATDSGTGSGGILKVRKVLIVSTTGRTRWVHYIPVKQATNPSPGRYDNNGAVEVELLGSGTGLTEWVDYIPIVEVADSDAGKWRYDNAGFIPILIVE